MKLSDRMTGHRFSCEIFCSESEYSKRLEYILSIIKHMILFLFCFYKTYDFVFKSGVVQATPATL